jgi:hypothetical protein
VPPGHPRGASPEQFSFVFSSHFLYDLAMSQSQRVKENQKERAEADQGSLQAYEVAIEKAIQDIKDGQRQLHEVRQSATMWEKRIQGALQVVDTLINVLPPDRKAVFLERARPFRPTTSATRGGETYDNVIDLFTRTKRPFWTASEIHNELSNAGKVAEIQQIHNVLNYLMRKGRLKRISRGRYFDTESGAGIETGDKLHPDD